MKIRDVMGRDFRVIDAGWPRAQALALVSRLTTRYVLIRHRMWASADPRYYLFWTEDALRLLRSSSAQGVYEALRLVGESIAPTSTLTAAYKAPMSRTVVVGAWGPEGILEPLAAAVNVQADRYFTRGGRIVVGTGQGIEGVGLETAPLDDDGGMRGVIDKATQDAGEVIAAGPRTAATRGEVGNGSDGDDRVGTPFLTRYLTCHMPSSATKGSTVPLRVALVPPESPAASGNSITRKVGAAITIVVWPVTGLELQGAAEGVIHIASPQADEPLLFHLTATKYGSGTVHVYAYSEGDLVASLELAIAIVDAEVEHRDNDAGSSAPIAIEPRSPVDLALHIYESENAFSIRIQSADGAYGMEHQFGPVRFETSPREHFREFFRGIENLSLKTENDRTLAQRLLANKGAALFEAVVPAELRRILWRLQSRIQTVMVKSDEPWIPWEVCRLTGRDSESGKVLGGKFFAEAFSLTRWLATARGPSQLTFRNWALVVPGDSDLAHSAEEREYILSKGGGARTITSIPANLIDVQDAMAKGIYDVWHFTGHARADQSNDANQSVIELEGGQPLKPEDLAGEPESLVIPRPFIFLNGCQSGRGGKTLTGLGGWAERFLRPGSGAPGAGGFMGTLWSVDDEIALKFACKFYDTILDEKKSIGDAVRTARESVRMQGDPTWLAYTVYAEPGATVG